MWIFGQDNQQFKKANPSKNIIKLAVISMTGVVRKGSTQQKFLKKM